jgi:hypothetical protein
VSAVYIFSKARPANLRRVVPRWVATVPNNIDINIVTDRSEVPDVRTLMKQEGWPSQVRTYRLRRDDEGIGYARRNVVSHAFGQGHDAIIMADDDIMPAVDSPMRRLVQVARLTDSLGVGATHGQHDLLTGGYTKNHDDVILCPSGYGFQLFALNVRNALAVGNYDDRLTCFGEDAELMRQGIAHGYPWKLHCGVKCVKIGKRGDPGGIQELMGDYRATAEQACQNMIHTRWPDFTSTPPKPSRMAWQKFYDYYIPTWRQRSAMHGGNL